MTGRSEDLRDRYIALIREALQFSFWPQPLRPVETLDPGSFTGSRRVALGVASSLSRLLGRRGLSIGKSMTPDPTWAEQGIMWPFPYYGETMIGPKRMENLERCVRTVIEEEVPGDLIETGVWRGGACIFMRAILAAYEITDRKVFVADSFEGLPPPNPSVPADRGDTHHMVSDLSVDLETVRGNFSKYDLLDDQVVFLEGWFSESLPAAPIDEISVLRLDGDMYGSTMDALENLHPKVAPGGFVIIDDYCLDPCRAAVNDYRKREGIEDEMIQIDWAGVYWRRPV